MKQLKKCCSCIAFIFMKFFYMPHFWWQAKNHRSDGGHLFSIKKKSAGQAQKLADTNCPVTASFFSSNRSTLSIWAVFLVSFAKLLRTHWRLL